MVSNSKQEGANLSAEKADEEINSQDPDQTALFEHFKSLGYRHLLVEYVVHGIHLSGIGVQSVHISRENYSAYKGVKWATKTAYMEVRF